MNTTRTCQNCNVGYGPDDMFCENCGYDFVTGSLPAAPSVLAPAGSAAAPEDPAGDAGSDERSVAPPSQPTETEVPRLRVVISVDRAYFDQVVNDGEIDFPDPAPSDQVLDLAGSELHIGRTSESRAIHPDIDVSDLTGDQAVSSRHAVIRVARDGSYTIVDVGSTNGTILEQADSEPIIHGVPVAVKAGVPIYVGAWTKLIITD